MTVTAELPLFAAATALALCALGLALPKRDVLWRSLAALACGALAYAAPLLLYPFLDRTRAEGNALWEWSAAGGPTIQAHYRLDGIGAIGLAIGLGYVTAGLFATARLFTSSRAGSLQRLLPAIVLANGFVFIALAVTDDLIAATVVLGALAAITTLIELIVAPAPAAARIGAYFAVGIQGFVVAALLLSRFGGPSFRFDILFANAASPGVVLAATAGAGLFAGLYPFVPWRYQRARARAAEREPLRGLLAMPAGIGATLVLFRVVGITQIDLWELRLPTVGAGARITIAIVIALIVAVITGRRRGEARGQLAIAALAIAAVLLYPFLHWSHVVLFAALLTVLYAAAVSLALADQWEVARFDVTLATLWVGLALGAPVALAAGLFVAVADAAKTIAEAVWMPPHRAYIALVSGSTLAVSGVLALGLGAFGAAGDPVTLALALVVLAIVLPLELVHIGRQLAFATVPPGLEVSAAVVGFLVTIALALIVALPLSAAVGTDLGRPFGPVLGDATLLVPTIVVVASLLVVVARTVRPLLPDLAPVAGRLGSLVAIADPVPPFVATFRMVERGVTTVSSVFALFERRAGAWLATLLIVALLIWSVR